MHHLSTTTIPVPQDYVKYYLWVETYILRIQCFWIKRFRTENCIKLFSDQRKSERRFNQLDKFFDAIRKAASTLNLQEIFDTAAKIIIDVMEARACSRYRYGHCEIQSRSARRHYRCRELGGGRNHLQGVVPWGVGVMPNSIRVKAQ